MTGPVGLAGLASDRCLVMGVVNVTPDSFSDGGLFFEAGDAVAHGLQMLADGADLLDVGGESTRPGAARVDVTEELRRVLPVVRDLAGAGAVVSVDTMRSQVAEAAVAAGAWMVNDVSGGLADPQMAALVADTKVPYVAMHWRGHSADMDSRATYVDVVEEVRSELARRLDALEAAGVDLADVVVDPGLGFAKNADHNWALLRNLDRLASLGCPVLLAASRKRFLGHLLAGPGHELPPAAERDDASAAVSVLAAVAGAWCVRVHEVRASAHGVRVAARWTADAGAGS